ncbi:MAG: choice-of-anchor D domain-containing protein [Acidobacteriaceae bacterium]|nr:choice-of-anchor D domain-containing protein [Acidobacteriaceae bacterium]
MLHTSWIEKQMSARTTSRFAALCLVAMLFGAASASADSLTLVTSQSAQNATDFVNWSQLGADGTVVQASFNVTSTKGNSVSVSLAGPNSIVSVVCGGSPCSWTGSGFPAQDALLWTSDAANGGNGPVALTFTNPVAGAGALIQTDTPGQFTAQVQAFNGATSLGVFTVPSDTNGDAVYIGLLDQSGANITSVVFTLSQCPGTCSDFALDAVGLNAAAAAVSLSTTSLTFPGQQVGSTSSAQPVTVTNSGSAALTISNIAVTGDFAQTNTCSGSIAPTGSCTINVTFSPTTTGTRTGAVTITDNASGSPQTVSLTGTGVAAAVSLSTTSLTFASQLVGTTSSVQPVTLTNNGTGTLTISNIAATGDYAQSNTCGSSVAAGGNCTINVTFHPTTTGTRTGTVTITDNASGSPQSISLTGTGVAPAVSLSTTSLTFASQPVGTTSSAQPVTLTNSGSATLTISSIVATGDYSQSNTCGSSVSAGGNCTINVTFKPTTTGTRTGTVTITDNASGSPQSISLTGTGVAPAVSLSKTSLTFASQLVGTTSSAQPVTLTNSGSATLTISSIVATGDYAQTNTCGSSVAAGGNCTISVTFHPTATGTRTGTVTITDNASGSPQSTSLTGTGVAPVVSLSKTSLTFASQLVGTTSSAQPVTLTNTGTGTLTISSIVATGDYAQTNTCGSSVSAGGNCTINVTFHPTATGTRTGTVTITDNASGSPQSISLTGTGVAPAVSLSKPSLTFASQLVGTTSSAQPVTLTNTGTGTLTISSILATGDYAQTNTCGSSVSAGGNCTINVTFHPTATGTRTGTVAITDNASGSPQSISLTGTGVAPAVSLSKTSLTFASQLVGTTSSAQPVTLTNTGTGTLTISSIAATGDYAETNTCGSSVAAGGNCTINVTFHPTATGTRTGTVAITDNASGSPQSISLTGTGVAPAVNLSATSLTFSTQLLGTTSAAKPVTLKNTGTATLNITSIAPSGDYSETNTCGSSLAVNATCTINVTFKPTAEGTRTGTVKITDNAASSPQSINLTGTGTQVKLSASGLSFPATKIGSSSSPQSVTITNVGTTTLTFTSITLTGSDSGDFALSKTCGSVLAKNASCSVSVTFKPKTTGTRTADVSIADNGGGSPQLISLTGSATQAKVSPTSLTFPSTTVGKSSMAQSITLTNVGKTTLTIKSIALGGSHSADYHLSKTCGSSLAASKSCTITVTLMPKAKGNRTAEVIITDSDITSPQIIPLKGTGL